MGSGDSIEIYGWLSVLAQLYSTAVFCQRLVTEVGRETDESGAVAVRKKLKGKVKSADP
jgi:hypothetical protein